MRRLAQLLLLPCLVVLLTPLLTVLLIAKEPCLENVAGGRRKRLVTIIILRSIESLVSQDFGKPDEVHLSVFFLPAVPLSSCRHYAIAAGALI